MSIGRKLSRLGSAGPGSRTGVAAESSTRPAAAPLSLEAALAGQDAAHAPDVESEPEAPVASDDRWSSFRSALRSKAAREERRPQRPAPPAGELPGTVEATEHGPLHRIDARHPLEASHGSTPFRALLDVDPASIARFALDDAFADVDPSRLVFLDTETTGLAGGAGTVPFLVGVAYLEDDKLRVEQWLLRRFGEEGPILRRLAEVLEGASALVTYNGKSFDWPLLRTRYVLHRLPLPKLVRHLDLVHGARRLLAGRLPSVRLQDVERELLGFVRHDDVDAALIPGIFLEFQRVGSHPDMERVIRHHALDLTAMPAMLARFSAFLGERERPDEALDRLACASVAARAGHDATSRRLVASMLDDAEGQVAARGSLVAAKQARRAGDSDAERTALERALAEADDEEMRRHALLELAKHAEHRARDLARALELAKAAHALVADEALAHRIARLERRLGRVARESDHGST